MTHEECRASCLDGVTKIAAIDPTREPFVCRESTGEPVRPRDEPNEAKTWRTVQVRARFNRFGQQASLDASDVDRARACLAAGEEATLSDYLAAIRPLAHLPVDLATPSPVVLYQLGAVALTAGDIRRARGLIEQDSGKADLATPNPVVLYQLGAVSVTGHNTRGVPGLIERNSGRAG